MEFNIADLFESLADAVPERIALVSGDATSTFAQLDARATKLANALALRGVKAGSHVGLYLYNGAEFVEAMLACFKLRAVGININYRYVEDELAYLFRNADLVCVIHQRELGQRTHAVRAQVPTLTHVIAVEDGSDVDLYGAERYEELGYESVRVSAASEELGDRDVVIVTVRASGETFDVSPPRLVLDQLPGGAIEADDVAEHAQKCGAHQVRTLCEERVQVRAAVLEPRAGHRHPEAHVGRSRRDAELVEELDEARVVRLVVDDESGVDGVPMPINLHVDGVGVPADSGVGLEHGDLVVRRQLVRGDEP